MKTWIALLRGVNVAGAGRLPMSALPALLEAEGLADVRTYVQSGNVVFKSAAAADAGARIRRAIARAHGFEPDVLVLSAAELKRAAKANPFPHAEDDPKSLHLFFLAAAPKAPDLEALDRIKAKSESYVLAGKVFYLHAPDGIGRSKLAAQAERKLGVPATARNWRTVTALLDMAGASGP